MVTALSRLLTLKHVQRLAGEASFQRGQAYCERGQVSSLVAHGDTLTASVTGTEKYTVRLAAEEGALTHRCSCPVGTEAAFCKHCVAVALAWLDAKPARGADKAAASRLLVSLDDLRPWLLDQPPATLAGFLLETAERDDRLREKLLRAAARATAKGIDLSAYRKSIDRATHPGGFIDYYSAGGFAERVREAVAPLRDLLADTPQLALEVMWLAEDALTRIENALENSDDSNGEISSLLEELQALHFSACQIARPDGAELAHRLFQREIEGHWDVFYNAAETYADLLGSAGLAAYRRLAEAEWKKLPTLKAGDHEGYEGPRFRLTSIMEALSRKSGDVDALAAVKAKNLASPYHYLSIAELYREAQRPDDALAWAERGLHAFPKADDRRLLEFLAEEYHRRKRHAEALTLIWRPFEATRPSLADYQCLQKHAVRADAWPHWRERALAVLRQHLARETGGKPAHANPWWGQSARSTLVQVFLWENEVERAWREGHGHLLSRDVALELAAAREKTHPADAIPIYLREAEALIAHKSNRAYEDAVRRLKQIKVIHLRLNLADGWTALLSRLRLEHKAKRNFIARAAGL